jgi:hypothetical protein
MRINFGKLVLAPAILAAAALAATAASAETLKVPFSFTAAGKVWPAGEYTVLKDSRGGQVTMRNKETMRSITFLVGPGEPDPTDRHVTLRFDENGDYHALRDIQYGSKITSRLDKNNRNMEMEEIRSSGR